MAGAANRRLAADAILAAIPNEPVTINLTGGEPLMLPDLTDLIGYLENYENLAEINIITNGTIEDHNLLTKLGSFARLRSFRISLESGDEKINDFIRGTGSLSGLRRTIPLYREITGKSVTLMMTLSRLNCETIKESVDFARETGADDILFERFIPLGTGLGISESLLSADDWYKAIKSIGDAADLEILRSNRSVGGDVTRLAAHKLYKTDAILIAFGFDMRGAKRVDCVGKSGFKAEGLFDEADIIIDGFRNPDNGNGEPALVDLVGDFFGAAQRAVASDAKKNVDIEIHQPVNHQADVLRTA